MKKILLVMFIFLFVANSAFCGVFGYAYDKAEQGDVEAQFYLGWAYYHGQEIPQDYTEAALWFTKAAEQGLAIAQGMLGLMYANGQGVVEDNRRSMYWYKKAAEQGLSDSQFKLGMGYFFGEGISQDHKQAAYWLSLAAEQGAAGAQEFLALMYYSGHGVSKDYKQALKWFTKAAEQDIDDAQYYLGEMFDHGFGVSQNQERSIYWYTKASDQGHADAQAKLGAKYFKGEDVDLDYKMALYWFTAAAEQGHIESQGFLGWMYYEGKGVVQNYQLSYVWLSLAAAQGLDKSADIRDSAAEKLSPQRLSEAQDLAAKIQYLIDHPSETQKQSSEPNDFSQKVEEIEEELFGGKIVGTGTGFFITRDGYILTCLHVVQDATRIEIHVGDKMYPASLVRSDSNNDLAILKVNGSFAAVAFSPHRSAKMGQDVFTVGYPNPGLQGVSAKYTKGTISSLTGIQDDLRLYQISIPIQPGNSGGALLDEHGNILGIVVAMLSAKTAFQMTGSLPQNVNYAVKSLYAQAMIDTMPEVAGKLLSPSKSKSDAIDNAQKSTVMVVCYD